MNYEIQNQTQQLLAHDLIARCCLHCFGHLMHCLPMHLTLHAAILIHSVLAGDDQGMHYILIGMMSSEMMH